MWLIFVTLFVAITIPKYVQFKRSIYHKVSGQQFIETSFYRQNYANYLTFRVLESIDPNAYYLTNLKLPHPNRSLKKIPLTMITKKGIVIFESMTKRGSISGNEYKQDWIRSFPYGKSNTFRNPIHTNLERLDTLKFVLNRYNNALYYSFVVMDERSKLEDVTIYSRQTYVIRWGQLRKKFLEEMKNQPNLLTKQEQKEIYQQLQNHYSKDALPEKQGKIVSIDDFRNEKFKRHS